MKDILLFDRVKELTHITGTSDILLEGAANGFSAFADYYSVNDAVFYAITDGVQYEVGSGEYLGVVTPNTTTLTRNSLRSSNVDNSKIDFGNGIKEVYSTYPGLFGVISNPEDTAQQTRESGVTFWAGAQTIDSDNQFVWDQANKRLGINTNSPLSSLHIGGDNISSELRVSGITLGVSGIDFVEVGVGYSTGRQQEPFLRNTLCEYTSGILELSGDVDQVICFRPQTAGTFLGVPSGACPAGCGDEHPIFRTLSVEDIPNLSGLYLTQDTHADKALGNIAFYKEDKNITYADSFKIDTSTSPNELQVSGTIKVDDQIIANSGGDNTIVNQNGLLVVPVYNLVSDVVSEIPASNAGAIAFASVDSYIMIANGTSWVSGQLV